MRHVCKAHLAEIITEEQLTLFFVQSLIDGKVTQVEEDVAHAGILPIENPDGVPVINKIAGEQVIVARFWLVQCTKRLLDPFHQGKNLGKRLGLSGSFRGDARTNDETCDQRVFRCEKMDNFCTNSYLCGDSCTGVFAAPIYAEKLRSFTSDAQHKAFTSDIHAVILVGDATSQRRDQDITATPTRYLP